MDELIRYAKSHKMLPQQIVNSSLVIVPLDKPVLTKGKVYYITQPITDSDEEREFAPVASQVVEYVGFNNLESDKPGTPAAHLFFSRLSRQKIIFRLTTQHFRQLYDERQFFLVTGKAARTPPPAEPALKKSEAVNGPSPSEVKTQVLEDPGFAAVIQALSSTTLQFQNEDRVSFQSVITDILQAQRVFNTLQDIQQSLGIIQSALVVFDSRVSQWENRFAVFFQQNRAEKVGMTTINNLKAQLSKGRTHLGPAKYQFGKLMSNLEQAKVNLQPAPKQ